MIAGAGTRLSSTAGDTQKAAQGGFRCRICGHRQDGGAYRVREMLFGTRESFTYFQCQSCGCLQIGAIPANLGTYYPRDYFSFRRPKERVTSRLRAFVDGRRVRYRLGLGGLLGRIFDRVSKPLDYLSWVTTAGLGLDARILDVGCGTGKLLLRMSMGGFSECLGVDPFVDEDILYPNGVSVLRTDIEGLARSTSRRFDMIMFHHSLEHLPHPGKALAAAQQLLAPGGCVLVRIPVADSYAWEQYREHWINLDAPRHLFLLTRKSLSVLAAANGLRVTSIRHDSTASQFVGSELYVRDIPSNAPRRDKEIFSRRQRDVFRERARELNEEGRGDTAVFWLSKA